MASLGIGVLLVSVAIFLIYKTQGLLVGEVVDDETLASLGRIIQVQPSVERASPPLTTYLGPNDVVLALDVEFINTLTAQEIEQAIDDLQDAVRAQHPEFKRIFVEAKSLSKRAQENPAD